MLYYAGLVLISGAAILFELALLRIFAIQQFYHFAFMVISLALLGAGASGSVLALRRRPMASAGLCLLFALTTIGAYLVVNYLPFDSFSIAWDGRQVIFLALFFLAAAVPFFFAGMLIGGELMSRGSEPRANLHQVYGANLIGSAGGSLTSLPTLAVFGGEGAVVIACLAGAAAGLAFYFSTPRSVNGASGARLILPLLAGLSLISLAALVRPPALLSQRLSPYKRLSVLSQALDAKHTFSAWDTATRVDVVESDTIHVMPGLSLLSPAGPPVQAGLMLDGDSLMPISGLRPDSEMAMILADHVPNGLPYRLRPASRTLVLEAGTGMEVLYALAAGAESVTAVEENGLVLEVVRDQFDVFSGGLYTDPRVTVVNQAGRVFSRQQDREGYDLAVVALTDPHRPVRSGAYSLTEDYTLTVEAFGDYMNTLDEDGLLVVTRWLQTPPSESARVFGGLANALVKRGLDPSKRLIAFRTLRTMTALAGRQPFSSDEIEEAQSFMEKRGFDAVYYPDIKPEALNRFNVLEEPHYAELFASILAAPERVYADYRFDIRPPTDDRPFFYHTFKWRQSSEVLAGLGLSWQPFGGSGIFVLVALLLLVSLASAIFILAPLAVPRDRGARDNRPKAGDSRWRLRVFLYFAALGLAFLFVEVPLAQRFILILDQPVTALAVVLFTILLFSGLGSLSARRWPLQWALAALVTLIAVYPLILRPMSELALGLPAWARISLTVTFVAPLGYLMGLPFAGGLRLVQRREPKLIPWAWAINGSFSVISSVLSVMVALSWGLSAVLWLGAVAYGMAWLSFLGIRSSLEKGQVAETT